VSGIKDLLIRCRLGALSPGRRARREPKARTVPPEFAGDLPAATRFISLTPGPSPKGRGEFL